MQNERVTTSKAVVKTNSNDRNHRKPVVRKGGILEALEACKTMGITPYEALKEAGFIKSIHEIVRR